MTLLSTLRARLALSRRLATLDRLLRRYGRANVVLAAAIAIPLLVNAVLLAGYVNAAGQRSSLARQVQEAEHKADEQLKLLETGAKAVPSPGGESVIPKDVDSTDMMDFFLKLAKESSVEVIAVNEEGVTTRRLGSRDYRAFKYSVQIRARVSQLVAFLNRLEQPSGTAVVVDNLSGTPKDSQNWLITVQVVAFAEPAAT